MTGVLMQRGKFGDTYKGRPCKDRGRIWSDAVKSQTTPSIVRNHQYLEKKHGTVSPSEHSETAWSTDTLISDFYFPEL